MLKASDFDGYAIPAYMQGGIMRYVNNGIMPGSFTSAILANDLEAAANRADEVNVELIPEYLRFFGQKIPAVAWGSHSAIAEWCDSFRVRADPIARPSHADTPSFSSSFAWPFPTASAPDVSAPERDPVLVSGGGGDFGGGGASSSWSDSSSSGDSSSSSSSDSGSCGSSSD